MYKTSNMLDNFINFITRRIYFYVLEKCSTQIRAFYQTKFFCSAEIFCGRILNISGFILAFNIIK